MPLVFIVFRRWPMDSKAIGLRLASARTSLGFSQKQVASYLGTSRETISYYESGARQISTGTLVKLANLYGYKVSFFIDESISEQEPQVSIAFRSRDFSDTDLDIIAGAKRIASNLLSLYSLLGVKHD